MKNRLRALGWRLDKETGNWVVPEIETKDEKTEEHLNAKKEEA